MDSSALMDSDPGYDRDNHGSALTPPEAKLLDDLLKGKLQITLDFEGSKQF